MTKNKLKKYKITGYCSKCKNKSFRLEKTSKAINLDSLYVNEVLAHLGTGYDLNTFDIICTKCNAINADVFKIQEQSKGDK